MGTKSPRRASRPMADDGECRVRDNIHLDNWQDITTELQGDLHKELRCVESHMRNILVLMPTLGYLTPQSTPALQAMNAIERLGLLDDEEGHNMEVYTNTYSMLEEMSHSVE